MGNKFSVKRGPESAFTKPTGLYPNCEWDDKTVKKLINKKKIAPRYPGREEQGPDLDECPICFLWYPGGLNRSKCCRQSICTECFLQFKKPTPARPIQCPFCNAQNYTVKFSGVKTKEEREAIAQEEQRVIEAKIRMRKEELAMQEEKEAELAAEREKRLREGPPPVAPSPPAAQARDSNVPGRQENARPPSVQQQDEQRGGASAAAPRVPPRLPVLSAPVADMPPPSRQSAASEPEEEQHTDAEFHSEIEDLMVMEAIRLSLLDNANRREGVEDDAAEAGAGRRVDEGEDQGASVDLDDGDADAGQAMDEEDWPAVTWGDPSHEAISRHQGGAAGPRGSEFEEQANRVAAEMEHDAYLFELLVFSNNFFTPDTSTPELATTSDRAADNATPPEALETLSSVKMPRDGQCLSHDGDEEDCYEESHNGIALEFEDKEATCSSSTAAGAIGVEESEESKKASVVEMRETGSRVDSDKTVTGALLNEERSASSAQTLRDADTQHQESGLGVAVSSFDGEGDGDAGSALAGFKSPSPSAKAQSVPASPFIDFVREHRALQEAVPQMGSESSRSNSLSSPVSASGTHTSERGSKHDADPSECANDRSLSVDSSPQHGRGSLGMHLGEGGAIPEGSFELKTLASAHNEASGHILIEPSASEQGWAPDHGAVSTNELDVEGVQEAHEVEVQESVTQAEAPSGQPSEESQFEASFPQSSQRLAASAPEVEEVVAFAERDIAVAEDRCPDDGGSDMVDGAATAYSSAFESRPGDEDAGLDANVKRSESPTEEVSEALTPDSDVDGEVPSGEIGPDDESYLGTGKATAADAGNPFAWDAETEAKASEGGDESAGVLPQSSDERPHVSLTG